MTSRTPPEIKWLLVERATIIGDISRIEQRQALLDAEVIRMRGLLAAMDTSIRLIERSVRLDAAGTVQRHCPAYQRRGALKEFLIATLEGAGEAGISARDATRLACTHFELDFASKAEFWRYLRNTVCPQLRRFCNHGLAESIPSSRPGGRVWRWKRSLPTFAELTLLSGSMPSPGAHDGDQDKARHQMAPG